jgi:hypothetical protein
MGVVEEQTVSWRELTAEGRAIGGALVGLGGQSNHDTLHDLIDGWEPRLGRETWSFCLDSVVFSAMRMFFSLCGARGFSFLERDGYTPTDTLHSRNISVRNLY